MAGTRIPPPTNETWHVIGGAMVIPVYGIDPSPHLSGIHRGLRGSPTRSGSVVREVLVGREKLVLLALGECVSPSVALKRVLNAALPHQHSNVQSKSPETVCAASGLLPAMRAHASRTHALAFIIAS